MVYFLVQTVVITIALNHKMATMSYSNMHSSVKKVKIPVVVKYSAQLVCVQKYLTGQ